MKGLLVLVAFVPVLLAGCGDQNVCDHRPPEVGAVVVDAQASTDPCAGQPGQPRRRLFHAAGHTLSAALRAP